MLLAEAWNAQYATGWEASNMIANVTAPEAIERTLERVLLEVQRPARYVGGEYNSVVKRWTPERAKVALAFPDIYDLGMPNLGLTILYDIVNRRDEMLAERVFVPWTDMGAVMRREGLPLYSLETKHPIVEFDVLGISLAYEQLYTNTLLLFDLAGMPYRTVDRLGGDYPLVVAGGHATYNPEPMADFIDVFMIGEGEEAIVEMAEMVMVWKREITQLYGSGPRGKERRLKLLRRLARLDGVYVPLFYEVEYRADGTIAEVRPTEVAAQFPVLKRIVKELPEPVTNFIVPSVDVVHNRAVIEIMRGCTRGCRFCHAGMVTRPVRERSVEEIVAAVGEVLANTGFEEVGLLSLSSSDYRDVVPLVQAISENFGHLNIDISMPSLRIETVSVDLMDKLASAGRRGGFTLAPEAATERMRAIINKWVSTPQVLETAREIYSRGWTTIKLYFMIGHPSETLDDVQAIAELAQAVIREGRKVIGKRANLNVGVSTFVPKPHTPFQWSSCDTIEQVRTKQALLRRQVRGPGLKLSLNNPLETHMEAWLSRGDRRLGAVILDAYERGASFDGWREHFRYEAWTQAFALHGLDPSFYTHRVRGRDETFPWDHIDAAVKKSFLLEDLNWSDNAKTRVDCRDKCFACGILPKFIEDRMTTSATDWECPEVKPKHLRGKKKTAPLGEMIPMAAL